MIEDPDNPEAKGALGKITIGDFREDIFVNLCSWNQDRYRQQWKRAVSRIVSGESQSALIVEYGDPPDLNYVMLWPMFRVADAVYIQNRMLFFSQLTIPFSPDSPWDSIEDRKTVNPEGQQISEWRTSMDSLRDFLTR